MTTVQLLEKREVWLRGVSLHNANLPALAGAVARTLSLPADKVFVTDVRPDLVVLDPPRPGAGPAVIAEVCAGGPGAVLLVACDPASVDEVLGIFRRDGFASAAVIGELVMGEPQVVVD